MGTLVKGGYTEVILRDDLAMKMRERLEKAHGEKRYKPPLSTYVQELLWTIIDEDELLQRYGPMLEELSVEDNRIEKLEKNQARILELLEKGAKVDAELLNLTKEDLKSAE